MSYKIWFQKWNATFLLPQVNAFASPTKKIPNNAALPCLDFDLGVRDSFRNQIASVRSGKLTRSIETGPGQFLHSQFR